DLGFSVAVRDGRVFLGDPAAIYRRASDGVAVPGGAVNVYDVATGAYQLSIKHPNPLDVLPGFGFSVTALPDGLAVGAALDDAALLNSGAAYTFDGDDNFLDILLPPRPTRSASFATTPAALCSDVLVGDPGEDVAAPRSGAVYRFPAVAGERHSCVEGGAAPGSSFAPDVLTLSGRFETKVTNVRRPTSLCNPAGVDGSVLLDPDSHLTCHSIADAPGQPRLAVENQRVASRFAVSTVRLRKASALCVPSGHDGGPISATLDAYKCYKLGPVPGTSRFQQLDVAVADRFGSRGTSVKRPSMLCTPV